MWLGDINTWRQKFVCKLIVCCSLKYEVIITMSVVMSKIMSTVAELDMMTVLLVSYEREAGPGLVFKNRQRQVRLYTFGQFY